MRALNGPIFAALALGCGALGMPDSTTPPPPDPLFPTGYEAWQGASEPVRDEANGELRRVYRSPDGAVLVKAHHALGDDTLLRLDVRIRAPGQGFDGWRYVGFDPATRKRAEVDAETCHLCHAAAPRGGTYTDF